MAFIIALMGSREAIYVDESTIDFPIFPYFLIQNFNHAAGHPVRLFAAPNLLGDAERVLFWCEG